MEKYTLKGLDCANCALKIENNLKKLTTVKNVTIDYATKTMVIDTKNINEVKEVIKKLEPDVEVVNSDKSFGDEEDEEEGENLKKEKIRIFVSLALFIVALIVGKIYKGSYVSIALYLGSYLAVGYNVILGALRNIKRGEFFDELFLMSISTIAAIFIGSYSEAAGVMLFYSVGELLQNLAVEKSRKSINSLVGLKPETANKIVDDKVIVVNPEELKKEDIILVRPGDKMPVDGVIIDGKTMIDTSALTGESVPRKFIVDDNVMSGMINIDGLIKVRVKKTFGESSIMKILEMIENASHKKNKTEKFITKFSKIYTPIVVAIAILLVVVPYFIVDTYVFRDWVYRAVVLLVISCPCALVLSIPLSYFAGIGRAAKSGILIKGANLFEVINKVKTVFLDKTGTITKGTFEVSKVNNYSDLTDEELIKMLAIVEYNSTHPIAKSILVYNEKINEKIDTYINQYDIKEYKNLSGKGIQVKINGDNIIVGNEKIFAETNIKYTKETEVGTVIYMVKNDKYMGDVVIKDIVKSDSKQALADMKALAVDNIVMLTGDNAEIAKVVADEVKVDKYYDSLLPNDKLEIVEKHMEKSDEKVAFVGDGLNDAPVMARVDLGIAMGQLGSDATIETADVVIMDDNISKIAEMMKISKKVNTIILENIIFIMVIKVTFIILGSMGLASMWEAVFADVGTTLIAIINTMRILKYKTK